MNVEGAFYELGSRFKDRSKAEREGVERTGEDQHPCAKQRHYKKVFTPTPGKLQKNNSTG